MRERTPPLASAGPSKTTIIYTTAGAEYDWSFTSDLGVAGTTHGKIVRRVEVETARKDEQCDRYASGCHMAVGETEWQKLVGYRLVTVA